MADTNPRVEMQTSEGIIVLELMTDVAPTHVDNFLQLVEESFYDGLTFHRIIPQFMIQGGCPHGDGTGGPGWTIDAEFNDTPHDKGVLSMARTNDPNSAGSQFFICLGREYCQHLDGQYTAFGKVIDGMDIVDRIAATPLSDPELGQPTDPPQIISVRQLHDHETDEYEQAIGANDAADENNDAAGSDDGDGDGGGNDDVENADPMQ